MPPRVLTIELPRHWRDFLTEVDRLLPEAVALHCLGGFVVEAVYGIPRRTGDVDYIAAQPAELTGFLQEHAGAGSKLAEKHRACLQYVTVADLPDDHERRLIRLQTSLRRLDLLVLDAYDLALSKLTRNSPKDREDVQALAQAQRLSFLTLTERYEREMKPWIANPQKHDLTVELWRDFFHP